MRWWWRRHSHAQAHAQSLHTLPPRERAQKLVAFSKAVLGESRTAATVTFEKENVFLRFVVSHAKHKRMHEQDVTLVYVVLKDAMDARLVRRKYDGKETLLLFQTTVERALVAKQSVKRREWCHIASVFAFAVVMSLIMLECTEILSVEFDLYFH